MSQITSTREMQRELSLCGRCRVPRLQHESLERTSRLKVMQHWRRTIADHASVVGGGILALSIRKNADDVKEIME